MARVSRGERVSNCGGKAGAVVRGRATSRSPAKPASPRMDSNALRPHDHRARCRPPHRRPPHTQTRKFSRNPGSGVLVVLREGAQVLPRARDRLLQRLPVAALHREKRHRGQRRGVRLLPRRGGAVHGAGAREARYRRDGNRAVRHVLRGARGIHRRGHGHDLRRALRVAELSRDGARATSSRCWGTRRAIASSRASCRTRCPSPTREILRSCALDTDYYESTAAEFQALYPRLAPGGVLIVDDYGMFDGSRRATDEYFATLSRPPLLNRIDVAVWAGVKPA